MLQILGSVVDNSMGDDHNSHEDIQVIDIASGGATTDSKFVLPKRIGTLFSNHRMKACNTLSAYRPVSMPLYTPDEWTRHRLPDLLWIK